MEDACANMLTIALQRVASMMELSSTGQKRILFFRYSHNHIGKEDFMCMRVRVPFALDDSVACFKASNQALAKHCVPCFFVKIS